MKLTDLPIDDTPLLEGGPDHASLEEAEEFYQEITSLLESWDYDWASDTLEGIAETVESSGQMASGGGS